MDANNAPVAGSVVFDAASRTVRLTPSAALTHGAGYTASVSAKSSSGVPMASPYNVVVHRGHDGPGARSLPVQHLERLGHPGDGERGRHRSRSSSE